MASSPSHTAPASDRYPLPGGQSDVLTFLAAHQTGSLFRLVADSGESVDLPDEMVSVIGDVAREMSRGYEVAVVPRERAVTTQDAAEILGVSRPYLVKLLESGQMPFHRAGTHRRVLLQDVLDYKEQRDRNRRESLRALTEESQSMGMEY